MAKNAALLFFTLSAACLPALAAHAQELPRSKQPKVPLEKQIPDRLLPDGRNKFFTVTSENDNYGDGSDQNYTNGVRFTYFEYGAPPPSYAYKLANLLPIFEVNHTTSVYYSFGQNMYTPSDISLAVPPAGDRPYAAFLYGSAGLSSISENHIDSVELTAGVVGPMALGEEAQTVVHQAMGVQTPKGWDYQLHNEPGLMLSWERRWPFALDTKLGSTTLRTAPNIGATVGNIYTYATTGVTFQLTPTKYKWQSTPSRVRPAIPGNGFFAVPDGKFAWSVFAGVQGRAMGRNIFLDGNTFQDSLSVDKKTWVGDANVGFSLTYGRTQFSYTMNWRSKEFTGQTDNTLFGAITIGRRF